MKPSLYSKIRPASEIKQVNTEFKVANDEIVSRVTKTEFNNLKIGGTNLLAKTRNLEGYTYKTSETYNGFAVAKADNVAPAYKDVFSSRTINIPNGTDYVLSFYAKASLNTEIRCHFYSPGTTTESETSTGHKGTASDGNAVLNVTTEWKRYWVRWKQSVTTETKAVIAGRMFNTGTLWVAGVKLEEGTRATDWAPAPEDMETRVTTVEEKITDEAIVNTVTSSTKYSDGLESVKDYVKSRGQNLVTNGTGLLDNNTNFTRSKFDKSDAYASNGSFTFTGEWDGPSTAELIPVNTDNDYRFKYYAKGNPFIAGSRIYGYVDSYDIDGNNIQPSHTMYRPNTLTTLAATLSPGATTVRLTNSANWLNTGDSNNSYERAFIFWNYVNEGGYAWPENTYSRNYYTNMWNAGGINTSTHTITLRVPWAGPTIPAGTKVSNGTSGAALKYIAGDYAPMADTWQPYEGTMGGVDTSGQNQTSKFHPGTASVRLGWLCNINGAAGKTWLSNISFEVDHGGKIKDLVGRVTTAEEKITADAIVSTVRTSTQYTKDVSDLKDYVKSRGENLVTNGTGLLGNNTNFSSYFTYDTYDNYSSNGSFTNATQSAVAHNDELMPVNPDLTYRMQYYVKANPYVGARAYGMVICYDADGLLISPSYTMYKPGTTTTLAQELKKGDTVLYLSSAANWTNDGTAGVSTHLRSIIAWNYVNPAGYAFPPQTYSRHYAADMWNPGAVNLTNNTIALKRPWPLENVPAGTVVNNGSSGSTYKYISGSNYVIPQNWEVKTGTISGIDTSGNNDMSKFHPGTASVRIGWLLNRDVAGGKTWLSNISFNIDYQGQLDGLDTRVEETESQITQTSNKISLVVKEVNGENKVDGNALVSAINVQPSEIKIASKNINIEGAVTFEAFDASMKKAIASSETEVINPNYAFTDWTSAYPEGYVPGSNSAPIKEPSTNNTLYAAKVTVPAGGSNWMIHDNYAMGAYDYITVESTFKLDSGALGGAGIMTRYYNSAGASLGDMRLGFKTAVPNPQLGRWYTATKTFKVPNKTDFHRCRIHVMAGWSGFETVEEKTIQFDSVKVRAATDAEIIALNTGERVDGWTMPGKTTINGGNIETNTIDVNRLKAGTISADTINISSANSGVTFNASGITATRGSIVVSMNSGSGFKITNSGIDVFRVESDGMIYAKGLTTLSEFNNLQIGGRNLLVTRDAIENTWLGTIGEEAYAASNDLMRARIPVTAGESLYFTKNTTGSDNFWRWNYYNTSGAYVGRVPNESNAFAWIVPADIASIWVSYPRNSKPKIERGTRPTDWTPAPEDVDSQIVDIYNKITTVEEKITAESITSTVLNAVEFNDNIQAAVSGKVNIEDLDAYTTLASLEETKRQLQDYADGKISAIDLSSYVSASQLTQTQNDFNFKLTSAGGVNLLQNSVGWAGDYNWTLGGTGGSGEYQVIKGTSELVGLGAGAAWKLNTRTITQDVPVVAGETYSFQMLVKKTASDAGGYIDIDEGDGNLAQKHVYLSASAYNWTPFKHTFVAKSGNIRIRIRNVGTGNTLITNVMLNKGPLPMQWTHAKNEIHNTNVRFDLGGIVVQNDATNGETRITPTEFAGYARDDAGVQEKIFTLNGDTTEVKKLKASEEFAMGPLRILQIESGSVNGWAFLPRD